MPRKPTGKPAGRPKMRVAELLRHDIHLRIDDAMLRRLLAQALKKRTARDVLAAGLDSLETQERPASREG